MNYEVTGRCVRELIASMYEHNYFPESVPTECGDYRDLPTPSRYAKEIGDHLRNQPIVILDDEYLGGAFKLPSGNCAVNDIYGKGGHVHDIRFCSQHNDYHPWDNPVCFLDWKHFCIDYAFILRHGLVGILEKIEKSKAVYAGDREKTEFLDGLAVMCYELKSVAEHIADAYDAAGRSDIAENLRTVPFYPAENFRQAMQSMWFCWLLLPDSIGLFDRLLYPYYLKDKEEKTLDDETAYNMICEFFVKAFLQHSGVKTHRSGDTTLSVGGYIDDHTDGFNELSRMMMEALEHLPIWRPQMSFRCTKLTKPEDFRYVVEKNSRQKNIVFVNDDVRIPAYEKMGVSHEDALNYTMIGCNEWTISGMGDTGSQGFFNPSKALETVLYTRREDFNTLTDFDAFFAYYLSVLKNDVYKMMDLTDAYHDECKLDLNVLSSILIDGCIEKAIPVTAGGAKYNVSNWACVGFANIVDSLSVIKQFVYDEKRLSLFDLSDALTANWCGYEDLRADILKNGAFFGNGNAADDIAVNFVHSLYEIAQSRTQKKGGPFMFGSYIGYNEAHATMGKMTLATPDGRYGGEALTAAMAGGEGKVTSGMAAYLNSVARIDYTEFVGPLAVNLMINSAPEKNHLDAYAALYRTFFDLGGIQLQPDYVSKELLTDAKEHPEKHRDLRVRVTGYSGFFVQFSRDLQDDLIRRTEF